MEFLVKRSNDIASESNKIAKPLANLDAKMSITIALHDLGSVFFMTMGLVLLTVTSLLLSLPPMISILVGLGGTIGLAAVHTFRAGDYLSPKTIDNLNLCQDKAVWAIVDSSKNNYDIDDDDFYLLRKNKLEPVTNGKPIIPHILLGLVVVAVIAYLFKATPILGLCIGLLIVAFSVLAGILQFKAQFHRNTRQFMRQYLQIIDEKLFEQLFCLKNEATISKKQKQLADKKQEKQNAFLQLLNFGTWVTAVLLGIYAALNSIKDGNIYLMVIFVMISSVIIKSIEGFTEEFYCNQEINRESSQILRHGFDRYQLNRFYAPLLKFNSSWNKVLGIAVFWGADIVINSFIRAWHDGELNPFALCFATIPGFFSLGLGRYIGKKKFNKERLDEYCATTVSNITSDDEDFQEETRGEAPKISIIDKADQEAFLRKMNRSQKQSGLKPLLELETAEKQGSPENKIMWEVPKRIDFSKEPIKSKLPKENN